MKSLPLLLTRICFILIKIIKEYISKRLVTKSLIKQLRNLVAIATIGITTNGKLNGSNNSLLITCLSMGFSLLLSSIEIPLELIVYLTMECFDRILVHINSKMTKLFKFRQSHITILKQILLGLLLSLTRPKYTLNTGLSNFLYGKSSIICDFLILYLSMDIYSLYQTINQLLKNKKVNGKHIKQYYKETIDSFHDPMRLPQPILNKFSEIYELSLEKHSSWKEKLLDSFIVTNLQICIKWTLWLRIFKILIHSNHKKDHIVSDYFIQSILLSLSFNMLNNSNQTDKKMTINKNLLKYLLWKLLVTLINQNFKISDNNRKLITLLLSTVQSYKFQSVNI
ncbi:hypothetical protein C6P45_003179 [Maudiozyma exigua]|uniref:Uncharacterized protein n=1 Tax=Maudiozyma exigua TaxID=34358 RepID=A0A9P7BCK7_MAUEX|nr:hypothetical protein C6P45_003179 [Kazachstania exigua]